VIVPFGYFCWKSLTLRVGDTWPMFLWPAGFAATAINATMLSRKEFSGVDGEIHLRLDPHRHHRRHRLRDRCVFSIMLPHPGISSAAPIRSAARPGYENVVRRMRGNQLKRTGASLDRDDGLSHLCDAALALPRSTCR
jgi:hypothetical protein